MWPYHHPDSAGANIQISTQGTCNFQPHIPLYRKAQVVSMYSLIMIVCTVFMYLCKQQQKICLYINIYIYVYPYYICIFQHAQWQRVLLFHRPPSYFWNQLPSNKEFEPREKRKSMSLQLAIFFRFGCVNLVETTHDGEYVCNRFLSNFWQVAILSG